MGEYWAPCNLTKREKYDAHGSIKTHGAMTTEFLGAVSILILCGRWSHGDVIRLLSDYGGESKLDPETFCVLEERCGPGISEDEWHALTDVKLVPEVET